MKSFLNQVASTAAGAVVFLVGCILAGLGLTVMLGLSMFALMAVGLAVLASPFVAVAMKADDERNSENATATAAG